MGRPRITHGLYGSDLHNLLNTHKRTCVLYNIVSCLTGGPHSIIGSLWQLSGVTEARTEWGGENEPSI